MTEQAHLDAIVNLLTGSGSPPLTVFKGKVPDNTATPYVRVYSTLEFLPDGQGNALDGQSKSAIARYYCHCVGGSDDAARGLAARVRTALLDVRPVITGRTCGLLREEEAPPPIPDESTGAYVIDAIRTYRLRTDPA